MWIAMVVLSMTWSNGDTFDLAQFGGICAPGQTDVCRVTDLRNCRIAADAFKYAVRNDPSRTEFSCRVVR